MSGSRAEVEAFEAWLDSRYAAGAKSGLSGVPFAGLVDAGERSPSEVQLDALLVQLLSGGPVLLVALAGGAAEVELLALQRDAEGGRRLVGRPVGSRSDLPEAGSDARLICPGARQLVALETQVLAAGGEHLHLAWPRTVSYLPGRAVPRVRTDLGGATRVTDAGGRTFQVEVVDASYGGLGLLAPAAMEAGAGDGLTLHLEMDGARLQMEAEVVHRSLEGESARLGLRLRAAEPALIRAVAALLQG